ncbi:two-component system histidine kinase PnpS [Cohnella caldifontis]|uniref:two-component system histidine kinase PnpS n=1 Tax=Cohnella caldifontis TaxID=3027471 RepID=UPI0023ED44F0|nr:ATP-binding protein [Cohnella sp. YIM B05605]
MTKFRLKLSLLFLLLIGISVLAAGLLSGHYYRQNHQEALRENMVRELKLLNLTAPWPSADDRASLKDELHRRALGLKQAAEMRVTYILPDGTVAGDSDHSESTMDNHSGRPEIRQALQAGIGSSVRRSDTLQENMMYVAMAVKDDGGNLLGFIRLSMSLDAVSGGLNDMWAALVFSLFLLFALAAAVSYRLAQSVTRPLERMTSAAERMSQMDYAIRVPEGGRDEIGALARALNRMAANLQEQLDLIRRNGERLQDVLDNMPSGVVMIGDDGRVTLYNRQAEALLGSSSRERVGRPYAEIRQHVELTSWIREGLETREPQYREMQVYYPDERLLQLSVIPMTLSGGSQPGLLLVLQDVTAIRRLENMRSEFVANVSHELKTPVAAVKGFAETLLAGALDDRETARSFLTIIHDESERLNRLIGDILELSKIESRRSPLQFSPIDLGAFLGRMNELVAPEAAKKRIALDLRAEEGLFLEADEDRLGQILLNLLQNGINYTPEGGRVQVRAETVPSEDEDGTERVRITVSDTGIGIPKKDIPRIFERFYRVDKARSRSSGGTGLGLSIVKHLVELHHGSIRVESEPGAGSRFIIELPLLQP